MKYSLLWNDDDNNSKSIEKNIHMTWCSKDILNLEFDIIKHGIKKVKDLNPDWSFVISDDNDVDEYLKMHIPQDDYELIKDRHIVEKSDLWRLLKIYNEGGFYQDLDRFYDVSLNDIIKDDVLCILPTYRDFDFAQDIMLSRSKNKIYEKAIQMNLNKRREGATKITSMGPELWIIAISTVLTGKPLYRGRNAIGIQKLRKEIIECPFLDSFIENPPYNTLTFSGKNKPNFDKNKLYSHFKIGFHP
jgi:hypothetical protein